MNSAQNEALIEFERAHAQVKLKRHELRAARKVFMDKRAKLLGAIRQDPDSWRGTPRVELWNRILGIRKTKLYDVEGEVITDDKTPEGQVKEAAALLAPPAKPGQDIPQERSKTR